MDGRRAASGDNAAQSLGVKPEIADVAKAGVKDVRIYNEHNES